MTYMFGVCKSDPSVPIEHLDYKYIETCNDVNELQKILQILRSGEEGCFPKLEEFTEKRLAIKQPNSTLLEKLNQEKLSNDLEKDERQNIVNKLQTPPTSSKQNGFSNNVLPPVRNSTVINVTEQKPANSSTKGKPLPRTYDEWSKIDKDLEQMGEEETDIKTTANSTEAHKLLDEKVNNTEGKSLEELKLTSLNEKNKGNEAFRSGDFNEALIYYNRSIHLFENPAVYNNRAITHIRLKNFSRALADCNAVVTSEPNNIKAYLRRGLAQQGLNNLQEAYKDFEKVLSIDPSNKRGKEMLEQIIKDLKNQVNDSSDKGTRLKVEEVDSETSTSSNNETPSLTESGNGTRLVIKEIDSVPKNDVANGTTSVLTEEKTQCCNGKIPVNHHAKPNQDMVSIDVETKKVRQVPADAMDLKNQGNNLFKMGQYCEALECYTKAICLIEKDFDGLEIMLSTLFCNRAICESKSGRLKDCIQDCDKSIQYYPSVKAFLRRGAAYEMREKYSEAYIDYQIVFQRDGANLNALQSMSRVSNILKSIHGSLWRSKLPKAPVVTWCKTEVVEDRRNSTSSSESLHKNPTEAITANKVASDESVSKEKSCDQTTVNEKSDCQETGVERDVKMTAQEKFQKLKEQGNKFVQKGEYEHAIQCYTNCIKLLPNEVPSYTNRALCYLRLQQPKDAIDDCQNALKLQPDNVKALFRRAHARKTLCEYKEALSDLSNILRIEINNKAAKEELAECKTLYRQELMKIQAEKFSKVENKRPTEKKGKKLKIEEIQTETVHSHCKNKSCVKSDGSQSTKTSSSLSNNSSSGKSVQLKKMSAYEFVQAWNSIKSQKSSDYAELLKQIEPTRLPELISNKLDGEMIKHFINAIHDHFTTKELYPQGISLLKSLSRVSRFVMMLMFLSTAEKTKLKATVDLLETRVKQNGGKMADIGSLRSSFKS